jgi:anti-sigma factor RsiW
MTMDSHATHDGQMTGGDGEEALTCKELVELVTAYRDGALSPRERERFEAHLAMCPPCGTYVEQMAMTVSALSKLDEQGSDEQMAVVEQEPATRELLRLFRAWKLEQQP